MTERRPDSKLSPATAKVILTLAAVAGTLGGWAVLAGQGAPGQAEAVTPEVAPNDEALPTLVDIALGPQLERPVAPRAEPSRIARNRPLRAVSQPPPRPVTSTRSSR